jgi:hypothetical protein
MASQQLRRHHRGLTPTGWPSHKAGPLDRSISGAQTDPRDRFRELTAIGIQVEGSEVQGGYVHVVGPSKYGVSPATDPRVLHPRTFQNMKDEDP